MGVSSEVIRAGKGNMFLSDVFVDAFVNGCETTVELYDTDGAEGAARAAGFGLGYYTNRDEMFKGLKVVKTFEPSAERIDMHAAAYDKWKAKLEG